MPTVPPLTDVSATLADLKGNRDKQNAAARQIRQDLFDLAHEPDAHMPDPAEVAALQILGRIIPPQSGTKAERATELHRKLAAHEAAAEVLTREIAAEEIRASAIIRERVRGEYEERLRTMCAAMLGVHAAKREVDRLGDELEAGRVYGWAQLRPDVRDLLGHTRDKFSAVNEFIRGAAKAGLISSKEVPAEARL